MHLKQIDPHSDALLLLDEIAQIDPKVVGDTVYMLANEVGKSRSTQTSTARKALTWRLLFLSDGEISLANHMAEAGKNAKGGHDVRMAHITANAGKGYGVFETLHGFGGGAELSTHLITQTGNYYGTPAMAFIEAIASGSGDFKKHLAQTVADRVDAMCPPNSHGQVKRVATRFALVAIAGELATHYGITGWEAGEPTEAATVCFADWSASRGGCGDVELESMRQLLPNFIGAHGSSRFIWWHRAVDDHAFNVSNRAGFRRLVNRSGKGITSSTEYNKTIGETTNEDEASHVEAEYFILPDVFQKEICKGHDYKKVAKLYVELGVIIPETHGGKLHSATRNERLPTLGSTRCYKIAPDFMKLTQPIVTTGAGN